MSEEKNNHPKQDSYYHSDEFNYLAKQRWYKILRTLQGKSALFYQFALLGVPKFTEELPTAAVMFNKQGRCVDFMFNPEFWDLCDDYTLSFCVAHECLHVILDHGVRGNHLKYKKASNIAMDIAINHMLVDTFDYDRDSLPMQLHDSICWIENQFPPDTRIWNEYKNDIKEYQEKIIDAFVNKLPTDDIPYPFPPAIEYGKWENGVNGKDCFEYYYNLLSKDIDEKVKKMMGKIKGMNGDGSGGSGDNGELTEKDIEDIITAGNTLDSHDFFDSFADQDVMSGIIDSIADGMSDKDKQKLNEKLNKSKEGKQASNPQVFEDNRDNSNDAKKNGTYATPKNVTSSTAGKIAGNEIIAAIVRKVVPKKNWKTLIKKFEKIKKVELTDPERWDRRNRRHSNLPDKARLPASIEREDFKKEKIPVWLFLDTSGSCIHESQRLFDAAKTLDRKIFEIKLFCFDTRVYETTLESGKLYGFGGTSFRCIKDHVEQKIAKEKPSYKPNIFVFTDGEGDRIEPSNPDNWYFFLIGNEYEGCLSEKINRYKLSQYEK